MYTISQSGGKIRRNHIACNTDKETDESWDTDIYNMIYEQSILGCGLGWTVKKKLWAHYEQLLRPVLLSFHG